MQQTLLELEKIISRQADSGFVGKINILKAKNNELLGYIFLNNQVIKDFSYGYLKTTTVKK